MQRFEYQFVKEDKDLAYEISILRNKLWDAIVEADYNLLNSTVQKLSTELDELIYKAMKFDD